MDVELSGAEQERYARALALPAFGPRLQERLKDSRALVLGAGPVGATVAAQVASAGVGYVGVVDPAQVAAPDFVSQSVHFTPDLGINKADSVAAKLGLLNPEVQVDSYPVELTADNADAMVAGYDVVAACVPDGETRLIASDACVASGIALIDCTTSGSRASVQFVAAHESACLRCDLAETVGEGGALPALGATAACFAAMEAVKLLAGVGQMPNGRLVIDGVSGAATLEATKVVGGCELCSPVEAHA